jgi:biopolymer transport protein ExbB/TolQ
MEVLSTVSVYFKSGGPFMFPILGVGVLVAAILLERFWVVGRASGFHNTRFARDVERLVAQGKKDEAISLCGTIRNPAAKVALHILREPGDDGRLQLAAEEGATLALPRLSRRLPHLTLLANVATLLGLLGTIFGLTTAFSAVSAADPAQRSSFLAAGISQALNTTSFGLIIAVPTLVAHGYLVSCVERIADQIDEVSILVVGAMARSRTSLPGGGREAA